MITGQELVGSPWRFCVAPMMKYTDSNYRYFARLLCANARLYSEMVVASAITKGDKARFLKRVAAESPVALQLGGSDPAEVASAGEIAEQYGFDEINLNVGCPSDRVQSGEFGACLMAKPALVGECVTRLKQRLQVPVTVKTRIGIDDDDSYEFLRTFVKTVVNAGVDALIIHARKAILSGLTPLQNRTIPPLRYDVVYRVVEDFPELPVIINGGIQTLSECHRHLEHCAGVMLGRVACSNPYLLAEVDHALFNVPKSPVERLSVLRQYLEFLEAKWQEGRSKQMMIKPLYGLYQGCSGAKQWRRNLNAAIHCNEPPTVENLVPALAIR